MKNLILFGLILFAACVFSCCTKTKEVSLVFVFDKPLDASLKKYPDYFSQIAKPFEIECEEGTTGILPKPIKVVRLDNNKSKVETNAWHFKDIGENTVDFSKSWLELYFKDSIPPSLLFENTIGTADVDAFIQKNKENTFIYSDNLDAGEYKGAKVFNESTGVLNELKTRACDAGLTKVYVLVNPGIVNNKKPEKKPDPEVTPILADELNFIANRKDSQKSRLAKTEDVMADYFETGAKVVEVTAKGSPLNGSADGFPLVSTWLKELAFSRTIESLVVKETKESDTGKVNEITVMEIHRGEEVY